MGSAMSNYASHLVKKLFAKDIKREPIRAGFGNGLLEAGRRDDDIWALCADLTDSTKMNLFAKEFPERFVEIGVAEQNLVTVASGIAAMGKIPFCSSYAAFSPGRNWEQIRTTICLNEQPVKIAGSHAGVSVGPDGATHQMLEDIALMRSLPHMIVLAPGDSIEAAKATLALAEDDASPAYIRLAREGTPVFTTDESPFEIGKAYVLRTGKDISLMGTGTMTYQLLVAAEKLSKRKISAEVLHIPTVKPIDQASIIASATRTCIVITAEEGQIAAGFGSAVAEVLSENHPVPILRIGMQDHFGESGDPDELLDHFGLTGEKMAKTIETFYKENHD